MATLTLNAGTASPITILCQRAGKAAPRFVGSKSLSFNGAERNSIRGQAKIIPIVASYVSTADEAAIQAAVMNAKQIPCSGDILGNVQTLCSIDNVVSNLVPGLADFYEMSFTVSEVNASTVLLKYSPGDTITGESFTRSTVAYQENNAGNLASVAINTKRDGHYIGGVRTLLMEDARINLLLRSEEFDNAAWAKTGFGGGSAPVVTADNGVAPDNTTTAEKVVFAATGAGQSSTISQTVTVTSGVQYAGSFYVKAFAGGDVGKIIVFRGVAGATYTLVTLTAAWQRVGSVETSFAVTGALEIGTRPDNGSSSGTVSVFLWGGTLELGAFKSSYIKTTTAAVARGADYYALAAPLPGELSVYTKFVNLSGLLSGNQSYLWAIGDVNTAVPEFILYTPSGPGFLPTTYHANLASQLSQSAQAAGPANGDLDETVSRLFGDGSVDSTQSLNGGAPTSSAQSAPVTISPAWSAPASVWLNSAGTLVGYNRFQAIQSFKIVAGARSLAEMRAA